MSLLFGGASTDLVDCGAGTNLANIATGSLLIWTNPNSVANVLNNLCSKGVPGTSGAGWEVLKRGADGTMMQFGMARPTTAMVLRSATGALTVNVWNCLAVTWDINADAGCKWYKGTLTTPMADVTGTLTRGSTTPQDDSAKTLRWGNAEAGNVAWPGLIARCHLFSSVLTLGQLQAVQFGGISNAAATYRLGWNGTGTQPDLSGNGNNSTAVTGATVGVDVPLPPMYGGFAGWRGNFTAAVTDRGRPLVNAGLVSRGLVSAGRVN